MAIDPRLMMVDYSPTQQAAQTFTTGMQNRRMKQVEGLAGQALMGDPSAMQNLSQLDPMMAKKVQMQMEEQKYTQDQRDMQRKSALSKELREFYTQFGSIEDADEFIMKGSQALESDAYPMMQDEMKKTGEFLDYSDYDTAKQFYEQSMRQAMLKRGDVDPSNIREWKYYNSLNDEQKQDYLEMKRSSQLIDTGGGGKAKVTRGGTETLVTSAEATQREADKAARVEEEKVLGQKLGEVKEGLIDAESNFPVMQGFIKEMNDLNDKATYTYAGQAWDSVLRQSGGEPREAAIARTKGLAMINNQVLPMLKKMLGAAFTEREGERVLALYGDANSHPSERKAALEALLQTAEMEIQRRKNYIAKSEGKEMPAQAREESGNQDDPLGLF